jgi:prephenate dehydratase
VPEALDAVRAGEADAAVVPLENSIGGQVGVTLDELATGTPLVIARDVVLAVEFVLAARAGITLDVVRGLAAHPQASAQCRRWLRETLPTPSWWTCSPNGVAALGAANSWYDAAITAPIGASRHRTRRTR